jgi:hypothetical protein
MHVAERFTVTRAIGAASNLDKSLAWVCQNNLILSTPAARNREVS